MSVIFVILVESTSFIANKLIYKVYFINTNNPWVEAMWAVKFEILS